MRRSRDRVIALLLELLDDDDVAGFELLQLDPRIGEVVRRPGEREATPRSPRGP
jgi:hypothetical protein